MGCQDQRNSDSPSTLRLVRVQLDRVRSLNERIDALHDDLIQLSQEVEMLRHIDDDAQRDAAVSDSYEDRSAAKMTHSDGRTSGGLIDCDINFDNDLSPTGKGSFDNEHLQIRIAIPNDYTCSTDCWWTIKVSYPGGANDTTTWSARIEGNPVRLVE